MACSSIIVLLLCHAPKSKSLWMMKSSHIGVCSKATTGGALVLLAVMGEPCLSRYDNILWMMAGSIMQAIIVTLCFWHFSHSVMSILL
ncbi:hypothetical protein KJ365_11060 [Glaciecola sp. XM2]|uniref:hypothetical protein n=1 Tax=Glaciecola sp. XM2 TaxID=1914931 RepID=UPI001BDE023B|nr:hypothetical protein [Glaciecola sp. XM2]MBT1451417.1 hypothetical protein [Glaciecola sp. XM2]